MILDTFPSAEEFYQTYWGKKPFIVRNYIPTAAIDSLIDGDTLAGLALEEEVKSRIITNNAEGNDWVCEHGPFEDNRFESIGNQDWSLLVQNVEQYHTDTAQLLAYFQFSPRWLLDDIMVSFSTPGGSVGPHTDSYHTFLVQGIGKRAWKISDTWIDDDRYADNPDMKVLQHGFDGEIFEVTAGDVIYMPPFFGHEGKTLEPAMTFSVGFLGPKLSEMLGDYAQYLEENESLNRRYLGVSLDTKSAGFSIAPSTQKEIQSSILQTLQSDHFSNWIGSYFSRPTHEDIEDAQASIKTLSNNELLSMLQSGDVLSRHEHIKLSIVSNPNGEFYVSAINETLPVPQTQIQLIEALNLGHDISLKTIDECGNKDSAIELISQLYNQNILSLKS